MEWVKRRAGWVLAVGLGLALGWTTAVTLAQPNWYDPGEACAKRIHQDLGAFVAVHTTWFPPTATCDFGQGQVQYMSTTTSVVLSLVGVLSLVVLLTGLILTVRRFSGDPGRLRPADNDLKRRRLTHLGFGAVDVGVAIAPLSFVNAAAIVFGGLPGGIICVLASLAGLSALGIALDRHLGPLPSTELDSRRRGAIAGVTVYGVIFVATALSGQLPFVRLWAVPVGAVAYAAIVAVQWSRVSKATQAQYSG
ncbi:hypothetical protein [Kribbella sp. NPDC055071]